VKPLYIVAEGTMSVDERGWKNHENDNCGEAIILSEMWENNKNLQFYILH
jgi:hypothetical protein